MNDQRGPIDGGGEQPHPSTWNGGSLLLKMPCLENDMREIKADLKRVIVDVADIKRVPLTIDTRLDVEVLCS
jgi:hypothetical protein